MLTYYKQIISQRELIAKISQGQPTAKSLFSSVNLLSIYRNPEPPDPNSKSTVRITYSEHKLQNTNSCNERFCQKQTR